MSRLRKQMDNYFSIRGGLENASVRLILVPQQRRIYKIAVMRHRHLPPRVLAQKRLAVRRLAGTRRRISNVAYGYRIGELLQKARAAPKDPAYRPHAGATFDKLTVARCYPGRLLPAVLQAKQTEVGLFNRLGVSEDSEKTAILSFL